MRNPGQQFVNLHKSFFYTLQGAKKHDEHDDFTANQTNPNKQIQVQ